MPVLRADSCEVLMPGARYALLDPTDDPDGARVTIHRDDGEVIGEVLVHLDDVTDYVYVEARELR